MCVCVCVFSVLGLVAVSDERLVQTISELNHSSDDEINCEFLVAETAKE